MLRTLHTKLVICITSMFLVVLNSNLKQSSTFSVSDLVKWHWVQLGYMGQVMRKCVLWHMRPTKAEVSLRIRAV